MTQTYCGASIKQWTFAKKSKQYTQHQLKIKSCLEFGAWLVNVKACAGVTKDQINQIQDLEMRSKLELRGGSDQTRNQLLNNRTNELITKFLIEGRKFETLIKDKYTAIWDIIKEKYPSNSKFYVIALNMEQYYMGFLDFGCDFISDGNIMLRRFQLSPYSSKETPHYQCVLEREGCHDDTDCSDTTKSNCDGETCVEHLPASFGYKAASARFLTEKSGSSYEKISESCNYDFNLTTGVCNTGYFKDRVIWEHGRHFVQPDEKQSSTATSGTSEIGNVNIDNLCLLVINIINTLYSVL